MKKLFALLVTVVFLSGCASFTPHGVLYTDGKMGVHADKMAGNRKGRACMKSYFFLIAVGDASIEAAKMAGGITEVSSVDHEVNNFLGIVGEYCTVVTGS